MGDAKEFAVQVGGHEATMFRVPLHEVLGIYEISRGDGEAVLAFDVDPDVHIGAGIVHGGLAPLLMDACSGIAVSSVIMGKAYVRATIGLTTAYHRPILGGHVEAKCRVVHVTKRHAHVTGEVWSEGLLCATGTVTLVIAPGEYPGSAAAPVPGASGG